MVDQVISVAEGRFDEWVDLLGKCVEIRGVSAEPALRGEVIATVEWTKRLCERLEADEVWVLV